MNGNGVTCGELSAEEFERLIREEGPLSAEELAAQPEAIGREYRQTLARRLERLGLAEFRRQLRKYSGRGGEAEAAAPLPRPIDDRLIRIFLEYHAAKVYGLALRESGGRAA